MLNLFKIYYFIYIKEICVACILPPTNLGTSDKMGIPDLDNNILLP